MRKTGVLLLALLAAMWSEARAQQKGPQLSASVRLRAESWQWFDAGLAQVDNEYVFGGALARVALSQQQKTLGWRIEAAAPLLIGLPENAVGPAPRGQHGLGAAYWAANDSAENAVGLFLKQAFVRVGAAPGTTGHALRAGRFEFIDGSEITPKNATLAAVKRDRIAHRLIGNFGFSHVQRSMDGLHYTYDAPRFNITAAAFRPTQGVFAVNGWPELDINVGYVSLNARLGDDADARIFGIYYDDQRDISDISFFTIGAHYIAVAETDVGNFDVLGWGAVQTGNDRGAYAFAIEGGLQPQGLPLKPWLRVGLNQGSGEGADSDLREDFHQLLPTPRIYARFPFYNMMNSQDLFASLILRPGAQVSVRADARRIRLTDGSGRWFAGGGAFEEETPGYAARPGNGRTSLGRLYDASIDYRPNPHWTVTGYIGFARGGNVIEAIYPENPNGRFGYLELEWRR